MQIMYINNLGGGFADTIEITEGTTVRAFFQERMKGCHAEDYLIRVNRQPAAADQVLQPGDRVTITPTKIHGACPKVANYPRNNRRTHRRTHRRTYARTYLPAGH